MKSLMIAMVILASLAPARAEDAAAKDRAERRLFFCLKVGISTDLEITGYLTESAGPGTGFDTAILDFDGDGDFEKKLLFGQTVHPRSGRSRRDARIPIRHEGATGRVNNFETPCLRV